MNDSNVNKPEGQGPLILGSRSQRFLAHSTLLDEAIAPRHIRLTILLACGALAIFLLWASVSELDEVTVAPGQIVPSAAIQSVQHQEGGIVKAIHVSEGQRVRKGQSLVQLDRVETETQLRVSEARYWGLMARMHRLRALVDQRPRAPELDSFPPAYAALAQEQKQLLQTHRNALAQQQSILRAQLAQRQADRSRLREQIDSGARQQEILKEVVDQREALARDRLVRPVELLETRRTLLAQASEVERAKSQLEATTAAVTEIRSRMQSLDADRRQIAHEELGAVRAELAQVSELLVALRERLTRTDIRSPADGIVQDLRYRSLGSVVPAGALVLSVVPVDDVMKAEVRIGTRDIGHVSVGQPVRVKLLTYDFLRYGSVDGKLESISASSFVDDKGAAYFKGQVRLARAHLGAQPQDMPITPGMTVTCDIVTGRKTVLEYLARPVLLAFSQGLRER